MRMETMRTLVYTFSVKSLIYLASLAAAMFSATSHARPPQPLSNAEQYSRAAQCTQGHNVYVDSAYPWLVGTSTGGAQLDEDNPPMLFHYGDLVTISCDAAVVGAWVMSTDPGVLTSTTGWISDTDTTRPGGDADGIGGAFKVLATSYRDQTVWRGEIGSPVGLVSQRTKGCSSSVAAKNAAAGGRPCDATTDCIYATTMTCSLASPPAGVYLALRAAGADTACWVCVER